MTNNRRLAGIVALLLITLAVVWKLAERAAEAPMVTGDRVAEEATEDGAIHGERRYRR